MVSFYSFDPSICYYDKCIIFLSHDMRNIVIPWLCIPDVIFQKGRGCDLKSFKTIYIVKILCAGTLWKGNSYIRKKLSLFSPMFFRKLSTLQSVSGKLIDNFIIRKYFAHATIIPSPRMFTLSSSLLHSAESDRLVLHRDYTEISGC